MRQILVCAGNKVWYTTMGAKDIIGHAISASAGSLPSKIKVSQPHRSAACTQKTEPDKRATLSSCSVRAHGPGLCALVEQLLKP